MCCVDIHADYHQSKLSCRIMAIPPMQARNPEKHPQQNLCIFHRSRQERQTCGASMSNDFPDIPFVARSQLKSRYTAGYQTPRDIENPDRAQITQNTPPTGEYKTLADRQACKRKNRLKLSKNKSEVTWGTTSRSWQLHSKL